MSQEFKFRYDEIREAESSGQDNPESLLLKAYSASYNEEGHGRNICFVCNDGKRIFLSYSYLISGEYDSQQNSVVLHFTTYMVTLTGIHLDNLFYDIMQQLCKQVVYTHVRYNVIEDENKFTVNDILIQKL